MAASAKTTTKEKTEGHIIYTLVTVTEDSNWATIRTRAVGTGGKTTRYAVVKSCDSEAHGDLEIKSSIEDEGNSFAVISISSHAFEYFYLITSISMPDHIDEIGTCAFKGCTGLSSVTIQASQNEARVRTTDEENDENNNSARRKVLFSTEKIDDSAFEDCTNLASVRLPSGIKKLGNRVFANCKSLKSISFTSDVQTASVLVPSTAPSYFGTEMFAGCDIIDMIYADKWVHSITEDTFDDKVYARKHLSCPEDAEEKLKEQDGWKRFFFSGAPSSESKTVNFADDAVKAICLANWDTNGDGVFSEEEAAAVSSLNGKFYQNEDIETFDELSYFTGLKEIGSYEFVGCTNLRSLKLPSDVTKIGYAAFANCDLLSYIEMPQTIESIGAFAFQDCKSMSNINLPQAITKIPKAAFIRCTSLQGIVIPENVAIIDTMAFMYCSQLSSVQFTSKLDRINQGAFAACSNMSSISLPASLTYIGEQMFAACTSLEALNIPAKVQTMELGIAASCTSLTTYTVDSNNPYFYSKGNGIVDKRTNMLVQSCKTTEIPTEIVGIADYGFIFVREREEVVIPENVKSIGYDAFQGCRDLKHITIPLSIEFIDKEAFLDCESLEQVIVLNPEPIAITKDVFEIHDENDNLIGFSNATLIVPSGSKAKYQVAEGWKYFTNIVEAEQKTLTLMVNRCERDYGEDNPIFTYTAEGGSFTGEPEITCKATKTSPVGIYPITISKGSIDFDGKITFIDANLSVTRATLTITADDKTMMEGDDMPELTVTYTGFKNNETDDVLLRKPTLSTTGSSQNGPGTYPIYVSGAYAENYQFKYVDGKLTIKKKEVIEVWNHTLVLNFKNGSQKKYMLKDVSDVQFSSSNLIVKTKTANDTYRRTDILEFKFIDAATNNDHVIFTADSYTRHYGEKNPNFTFKSEGASYKGQPMISCEATINSPVGTYPILISQGSVDNDNTTFLQGTLTVTKTPLTVTADNKTIIQGDDIPELTFSYAGFVNGETESVLIRKPVANTTATSESKPGEYPITVRDGAAQNYEFYYKDGILTIEAQKPVIRYHTLIMHLNDGKRERFILSDQPFFVISNEKLIAKTSSMGAVYLRSDIKEFTFEETADGIYEAPNTNETIIRQLPNGNVAISGLEAGVIVRVYDLKGYMIYTSDSLLNTEMVIPFENRTSGVYIININNKRTIKIQKK